MKQAQDPLHTSEVPERMARREQRLHQLRQLGPNSLGLGLRRANLKATNAEFAVGIVLLVRGELPESGKAGVRSKALVLCGEDFDEFVAHPHADGLTNALIRHRVEVFVDLDVAIRMHLRRAPIEQLEACGG